MTNVRLKYIFLILCLMMFHCQKSKSIESQPFIATSIFPIYDLVRQVAGNTIDTGYFVPANANPHTYEPLPSQVVRLHQATCYIGVQREFDGWVEQFLSPGTPVCYLNPAIHPHSEINSGIDCEDPHIWLSVRDSKILVEHICRILSEMYPESEETFTQNAKYYLSRLDSVDAAILNRLLTLNDKKFIQWHPAWDRFARDYHLKIIGTIENGHGQEISVKSFQSLINKAQQEGVKAVIVGLNTQSSMVSVLVQEIHGKVVYLDTMGDPENPEKCTYVKLMLNNARHLADELEAL